MPSRPTTAVKPGFYDMAQAVNYLTSHDVEKEHESRIMNFLLAPLLESHGYRGTALQLRWSASMPIRRIVSTAGSENLISDKNACGINRGAYWLHGVCRFFVVATILSSRIVSLFLVSRRRRGRNPCGPPV